MTGTPLADIIAAEILATGPMTVARYMGLCLSHRVHGYYMTGDPFGAGGDFITAPEISQMFGELVGLWCADTWSKMDPGGPVVVAELGPGRGTLMADALRAARISPEFFDALSVHLVETSPALRRRQKAALENCGKPIEWHERFEDLPEGPLLVIANELFDALPVHQLEVRDGEWRERCVMLAPDGSLAMTLSENPLSPHLVPPALSGVHEGAIFETAPERTRLAGALAASITRHGGAALIIDYGHASSGCGDTLQAVRAHKFADPLASPGEADITSHIDFAALARTAGTAGATTFGPIGMGPFLEALGLRARAERLKSGASAATIKSVDAAVHRLTGPDQMGSVFKVLVLARSGGPAPAPF